MIDTTEITPENLKKAKKRISELGLTLEQTPWELILWNQSSMQMVYMSHYWSDILEVISEATNFCEYTEKSSDC